MGLTPDSPKPVMEVFYTPEFKRNVRTLAKKYHHIQADVQPIIEKIQGGELIGDKVQGTGRTIRHFTCKDPKDTCGIFRVNPFTFEFIPTRDGYARNQATLESLPLPRPRGP